MEPIIVDLLGKSDYDSRVHIIQRIIDDVGERVKYTNLPRDIRLDIAEKETQGYRDLLYSDIDVDEYYSDPYSIIYPKTLGIKGYILNFICRQYLPADIYKIYYYRDGKIVIIDKLDLLIRNATRPYLLSYRNSNSNISRCDRNLLSKLIDEGIIIIEVYGHQHYITFFKDRNGNYIGTSTIEDGLTDENDYVDSEEDE